MFCEVFLTHNHDTRNKSEPVLGLWKSIAAKKSIRFASSAAIAPTDILEKINLDDIILPRFSIRAVPENNVQGGETQLFSSLKNHAAKCTVPAPCFIALV